MLKCLRGILRNAWKCWVICDNNDRYRFVRDVQNLASMNAPKKPLNQRTSNLTVLCCKSLLVQPFPYHANWLACITGVCFSGERRQARSRSECKGDTSEERHLYKGYVWGGMQQNNGTWTGCCFFCVFPVALVIVWRFLLTSRLPSLACKNAKKITPVMQATNWLKTGPKRRIWSIYSQNCHCQNSKPRKKCLSVIFFGNGTCYSVIKQPPPSSISHS